MADGVFLTWDVLAGLLVAAALTGVAGHLTGALLYTRNQFRRHKVMLFDPVIGAIPSVKRELEIRIDGVESKIDSIKAAIPNVPTLEEIANEVQARIPPIPTVAQIISEIPPYPDVTDKLALLEERMGAKLSSSMDAKWGALQEQLSLRVGQVVQANIASAKAAFSRANSELQDSMSPENDGSMLTEVLGIFMDEDSVKKVSRAKTLFKRFQAQGGLGGGLRGGATPQGGYPLGTVINGYVATASGWLPIAKPQAPPALSAPAAARSAPPPSEVPPELPPEPKPPA